MFICCLRGILNAQGPNCWLLLLKQSNSHPSISHTWWNQLTHLTQGGTERHRCIKLPSCDGYDSWQGHPARAPEEVCAFFCDRVFMCAYVRADPSTYEKTNSLGLALKGLSGTCQWLAERGHLSLGCYWQSKMWGEAWRVTCISPHVLNQLEAQVMLWKIYFLSINITQQLLKRKKAWWMVRS